MNKCESDTTKTIWPHSGLTDLHQQCVQRLEIPVNCLSERQRFSELKHAFTATQLPMEELSALSWRLMSAVAMKLLPLSECNHCYCAVSLVTVTQPEEMAASLFSGSLQLAANSSTLLFEQAHMSEPSETLRTLLPEQVDEWNFQHCWGSWPAADLHLSCQISSLSLPVNPQNQPPHNEDHLSSRLRGLLSSLEQSNPERWVHFQSQRFCQARHGAEVYLKCKSRAVSIGFSSCPWKMHAVISLSCSPLGTPRKINLGQRRGENSADSSSLFTRSEEAWQVGGEVRRRDCMELMVWCDKHVQEGHIWWNHDFSLWQQRFGCLK